MIYCHVGVASCYLRDQKLIMNFGVHYWRRLLPSKLDFLFYYIIKVLWLLREFSRRTVSGCASGVFIKIKSKNEIKKSSNILKFE